MRALWIVCPVFYDADSFALLRQKILVELASPEFAKIQFIVIDAAAGADASISQLTSIPDVQILTPIEPMGHQSAIVYGLRNLEVNQEDIVITMDADGEDKPEDLPRLLAALKPPITLALAYRTSREETAVFKCFYFLFKVFFRIATGQVVRTGNYAAFSGATLIEMISHHYFDHVYSTSLLTLHKNIAFVPCARGTRYFGVSKMSLVKLIKHGLVMLLPFIDQIRARLRLGGALILSILAGWNYATGKINATVAIIVFLFVALNVLLALIHLRKANKYKAR